MMSLTLRKQTKNCRQKNEGLQLKFEEEITNNSNRFQRVERELTSLSQSINDIRKVQTETAQDLRNISSSLSTVEEEPFDKFSTKYIKTNQELQAKHEGLQLKFEEEITNNLNRFQRAERELTSLSQSINNIRKVQTETAQDLRNISSSLSTVEKDILQSMKTTPATLQSSTIAFYAYMSRSTGTINGQMILVFDVVKTNIGGGYLPSSGNFVVPVTGTYVFSWTFRIYGDSRHSTQLMVNGVEYGIIHLNTNPDSTVQETGLVVVNVVKGDIVLVRTHANWNKGSIDSTVAGRSSFAGWML